MTAGTQAVLIIMVSLAPKTVPGTHTFPSTTEEPQPLISLESLKKQGTPVGLIGVCQNHP